MMSNSGCFANSSLASTNPGSLCSVVGLTLDQIKKPVTPRQDMSAALDVLAPQLNVRLTVKRFLRAGLTEPAASLLYVRG